MTRITTPSLVLLLAATACSKKDDGAAKPPAAQPAPPEQAEVTPATKAAEPAAPEPTAAEPAADPPILTMIGFPNVAPDTQAGQFAFAPNDTTLKTAVDGAAHEKGRLSYGVYQVVEPGPIETKVKWMGGEWTVPNALITPIPKEVEVAVGDMLAASRYGNSYDHAIVTKEGTPPIANFMQTMPYTKEHTATLKANQYIKLDGSEWQPGSIIAYKTADTVGWESATVIRVVGDKLLLRGPVGALRVSTKSDARVVPLKPDVKKGDTIFGVWDSVHFTEATLEKIDGALGLYHIRMSGPFAKEVKYTPFGMLLPEVLAE